MKILQWYSTILFSLVFAFMVSTGEVFILLLLIPTIFYFWGIVLNKKMHKAFVIYSLVLFVLITVVNLAFNSGDAEIMFGSVLYIPTLMQLVMEAFGKSIK